MDLTREIKVQSMPVGTGKLWVEHVADEINEIFERGFVMNEADQARFSELHREHEQYAKLFEQAPRMLKVLREIRSMGEWGEFHATDVEREVNEIVGMLADPPATRDRIASLRSQ